MKKALHPIPSVVTTIAAKPSSGKYTSSERSGISVWEIRSMKKTKGKIKSHYQKYRPTSDMVTLSPEENIPEHL